MGLTLLFVLLVVQGYLQHRRYYLRYGKYLLQRPAQGRKANEKGWTNCRHNLAYGKELDIDASIHSCLGLRERMLTRFSSTGERRHIVKLSVRNSMYGERYHTIELLPYCCDSDNRSSEYTISSSAPVTNSFTSNRSNEHAIKLVKMSNLEVYKLPIHAGKTRSAT
jgi:hypothetical protein